MRDVISIVFAATRVVKFRNESGKAEIRVAVFRRTLDVSDPSELREFRITC